MSKIIALFCLCSAFLFAEDPAQAPVAKKKILILSSKGGGGHLAASNTLQKLIGEEYDLKIVYPINELRIWGVPSCERVYNSMLANGWIRTMNFIVRHVAPPIFRSRMSKLEKIISSCVKAHNPDLVISLIPFVNYPASEAARKKDVPFLLITTDNDLRNWVLEMDKIKHPQFKITIGADLPSTRGVLLKTNIPESSIETIGLPLRPDFMNHKDKQQIREEFQFPDNKRIILIMMGGAGSSTAYKYAKKIGRMDLGAHLVVVAGRNASLKKDVERMPLHPSNSLTAFGFTDRVSDIMAVSDLIITKPGPGTINEAIAMKLPMLIDNTDISLFWERANVDMVTQFGIGQKIKQFDQLRPLLQSYLKNDDVKGGVVESFITTPSNQFHLRLPQLIREMIALKETGHEAEAISLAR